MDTFEMFWEFQSKDSKDQGGWLKFNFGQVAPYRILDVCLSTYFWSSVFGCYSQTCGINWFLAWTLNTGGLFETCAGLNGSWMDNNRTVNIVNDNDDDTFNNSHKIVKPNMHYHVIPEDLSSSLKCSLHPRSPLRLQPLASLGDSLAHWPCERLGPHRLVVRCHGLCKARLGDPEAQICCWWW